jgi:hypothetical protein
MSEILPSQRGKRNIIRPSVRDQLRVGSPTIPELRTAHQANESIVLLLANTYQVECQRYSPGSNYDPYKFAKQIGEIPSERRRGSDDDRCENIEDANTRSATMSVWFKIADLVRTRRFDPETYIRRQFAMLPRGGKPPLPTFFMSDKAVANYLVGLIHNEKAIGRAMHIQADQAMRALGELRRSVLKLTGEKAAIRILIDTNVSITSLFRYTMAMDYLGKNTTRDKAAFQKIAERFKEAAALQYVFDSEAYDKVWQTRIPLEFREEAHHIYNRIHGIVTSGSNEEF